MIGNYEEGRYTFKMALIGKHCFSYESNMYTFTTGARCDNVTFLESLPATRGAAAAALLKKPRKRTRAFSCRKRLESWRAARGMWLGIEPLPRELRALHRRGFNSARNGRGRDGFYFTSLAIGARCVVVTRVAIYGASGGFCWGGPKHALAV